MGQEKGRLIYTGDLITRNNKWNCNLTKRFDVWELTSVPGGGRRGLVFAKLRAKGEN